MVINLKSYMVWPENDHFRNKMFKNVKNELMLSDLSTIPSGRSRRAPRRAAE